MEKPAKMGSLYTRETFTKSVIHSQQKFCVTGGILQIALVQRQSSLFVDRFKIPFILRSLSRLLYSNSSYFLPLPFFPSFFFHPSWGCICIKQTLFIRMLPWNANHQVIHFTFLWPLVLSSNWLLTSKFAKDTFFTTFGREINSDPFRITKRITILVLTKHIKLYMEECWPFLNDVGKVGSFGHMEHICMSTSAYFICALMDFAWYGLWAFDGNGMIMSFELYVAAMYGLVVTVNMELF